MALICPACLVEMKITKKKDGKQFIEPSDHFVEHILKGELIIEDGKVQWNLNNKIESY